MKRTITAVFLSIALIVALTACKNNTTKNKTENTTESVSNLPKYGFREYTREYVSGERYLSAEYENLGTERALTEYKGKDGEVGTVEKWYYDDTGEHLLKHVLWRDAFTTEAQEYDMSGRLIRKSVKKQGARADQQGLYFPSEYSTYSKRENKEVGLAYYMNSSFAIAKSEVQEIVTEFTYFDESDTIKGIKTVTDSGAVIGSLERGEGDIILSASIDGKFIQYEEKYDPATGCSEFNYERLENNKVFMTAHGTRKYNLAGNYLHILVQNEEGPDAGLTVEAFYEYDVEGGYRVSLESRPQRGSRGKVSTDWYDAEGKRLRGETITDGSIKKYEYTYYENGNVLRHVSTADYGSGSEDSVSPEGEEFERVEQEYFEDGRLLSERSYRYGELTSETFYTFVEMQGVAGQVLYRRVLYDSGEEAEQYSVFMPDKYDPAKTEEVVFRAISWDEEGNLVYHIEGQFDSEGRLIRKEETPYGTDVSKAEETGSLGVTEFDEKGRMTRKSVRYWPNTKYNSGDTAFELGKEWEYWEGEKPAAAE